MTTTKRPEYWSCEPGQWAAWVDALGFAAASKLAGACMTYFFEGELDPSVKLTKQATAIFEGIRPTLERRRSAAMGKARGRCERDLGRPGRNVENSEGLGKPCGKSAENSGKVGKKSEETSTHDTTCGECDSDGKQTPSPAKTHDGRERDADIASGLHQEQEQNHKPPKPPAPTDRKRAPGLVTPSELREYKRLGLVDYDLPTSYGTTSRLLRAV